MNHGYKDRPIGPNWEEEGEVEACDNCEQYFPTCDLLIIDDKILCERCFRFRGEEE